VSTPVRRRLPDGEMGPTPRPRPRIKKRNHGVGIVLLAIIGFGVYASNRHPHHAPSITTDESDLTIVSAPVTVAPGASGAVAIRLGNDGPDDLDHNVTFTIVTGPQLTITGAGTVIDNHYDRPFFPRQDCKIRTGGHAMSCTPFLYVSVGRQVVWRVPVRVAPGTSTNAALRLTVSAVGSTLYTDPDKTNNRNIGYPVLAGRPGPRPSTSAHPSTSPPSSPRTSSVPTRTAGTTAAPSSTKSPTSTGKRIRNAARSAVGPVTIALSILVGVVLLIVLALVFVARRQRRAPLNYIPPPRK
jgi:hypothetical protein